MSKYLIRKVIYEESEVEATDLMPMKEAAEALGMTLPGVIRAIERGQLAEYVDSSVSEIARKNRRYLLREEVEAWKNQREGA